MTELPLSAILNLDKPAGISSAAALNRLKRLLPRGTKIGHAGTLDPFATGVLLVLIGKATKLSQKMMEQQKEYDAEVTFGATTATDDPESRPTIIANVVPPTESAIATELEHFTGIVLQRPPAFSAMKIAGRRAYDVARGGGETHLSARPVRIDQINISYYDWPHLGIHVVCGKGAYIRAIARDLGEALRIGGYLSKLRRSRIGPYRVEDALSLSELIEGGSAKMADILRRSPADL